ncbi:hypothetical protein ACIOHC_11385 [Streptomyces sp. NPDC088252]|uniref:hypothetical protein n=1 Tax=unclassified Streptomyces TaxID=2593676 RepID=UPI0038006ABB
MTGPEHYREAERLAARAHHFTYGDGADPVVGAALAAEAQVHATLALVAAQTAPAAPQLETEPAVEYVYRAAWGMTPLGTYTNQDAARIHCETDALNNSPEFDGKVFDWLGDESEPNDPYELVIGPEDDEQPTDYTVTRIEVAAEYDPEADA